jgi:hypothetical protein
MSEIFLSLQQLRGMIGLRVKYHGETYVVIEVLDDSPAIVMQPDIPRTSIQPDAYGNAHREIGEVITIPVLTSDRQELHPEFLEIDLI